jgi:FkbM family methyltransferase
MLLLKILIKIFGAKLNNRHFNSFGFKILIEDIYSFYYELVYIWKDGIYDFITTKDNPVIIDGGSCIGVSVLYFKSKHPKSTILAFEPDQRVFKLLESNIERNQIEGVKLFNVGLYKENTTLSFDNSTIDSGKIQSDGKEKISVDKLSEHIKDYQEIDFLKLNIEGAEKDVVLELQNADQLKKINQICIEWHSFANNQQDLDEMLKALKDSGFKYYLFNLSTQTNHPLKIQNETEFFIMIRATKI